MEPSLDSILSALANPTRRAILDRLIAGEASAGDLAAPFALSQPTISSHLKVLEAAGLVTRSRRATQRPVRLEPAAMAALDAWIGPYRRLWEDRLHRLENHARTLHQMETAMPQSPTEPTADRAETIVRVMDVPARYIFQAYAQPEHLMRWFGPVDYPVTHCEVDFRVGGKWRMIMTGPDGKEGPPFGGTYLEIVPDSRIVFDDAFEDGHGGEMNLKHSGRIVFTVTLAEADGKTTLTLHLLFDSAAMKAEYLGIGMLEGIASGFDQLQGLVAELARAG